MRQRKKPHPEQASGCGITHITLYRNLALRPPELPCANQHHSDRRSNHPQHSGEHKETPRSRAQRRRAVRTPCEQAQGGPKQPVEIMPGNYAGDVRPGRSSRGKRFKFWPLTKVYWPPSRNPRMLGNPLEIGPCLHDRNVHRTSQVSTWQFRCNRFNTWASAWANWRSSAGQIPSLMAQHRSGVAERRLVHPRVILTYWHGPHILEPGCPETLRP